MKLNLLFPCNRTFRVERELEKGNLREVQCLHTLALSLESPNGWHGSRDIASVPSALGCQMLAETTE